MSGRSTGRGMRPGAAVLLGLVLPFGSTALPAQDLAIVGATIHPVAGPSIERGTLLVRDGVIVAVGADLDVPASVRRIDGTGKVVTPGLFDASTQIGLAGMPSNLPCVIPSMRHLSLSMRRLVDTS